MANSLRNSVNDNCPHIDRNDPRCGHRFRLGGIDQAFSVCMGAFHGCAMFHRLNHEQRAKARAAATAPMTITQVTAHGSTVTLRPTGT